MKKRDRLEIIKDILKAVSGQNVKPTHVMYKANLSHQMLTDYSEELIEKKLIEIEERKQQKYYRLTKKGYEFLKDYQVIRGFMDSYGLD